MSKMRDWLSSGYDDIMPLEDFLAWRRMGGILHRIKRAILKIFKIE